MAGLLTWSTAIFPILLYLDIMCRPVSGEKVSACLKEQKDFLNMNCSTGYMVQILRAFYGYSAKGGCSYDPREEDCTLDEVQNYPCIGRETCRINLPSWNRGRTIKKCNNYSNYFQVEYQCVKASNTEKLCDKQKLTAQSGYISTPRYPNNLRGPFTCNLRIEVQSHQKIRLHIIDLDLKGKTGSNCTDYLYMDQVLNSITVCGRRGNETISTLQNVMNLLLTVGSNGTHKGLWLYYEAFPPLPSTPSSTEVDRDKESVSPVLSVTSKSSLSGEKPNMRTTIETFSARNSQRYHSDASKSEEDHSVMFVAGVAGVIGTLLFILIGLLTFLVFKMQRERRKKDIYSSFVGRNRDLGNKSTNQTIC